ncbi:MAG: hypothetical protein JXR63_07025 [Spirochaetales bacterium]|nr:hypothetical protein [Spirochaetales bacterium]
MLERICIKSRAEVYSDEIFTDISSTSKRAGISANVRITEGVKDILKVPDGLEEFGQSFDLRLWDLVSVFYVHWKRNRNIEINFSVLLLTSKYKKAESIQFKSIMSIGEEFKPVITIMLPREARMT